MWTFFLQLGLKLVRHNFTLSLVQQGHLLNFFETWNPTILITLSTPPCSLVPWLDSTTTIATAVGSRVGRIHTHIFTPSCFPTLIKLYFFFFLLSSKFKWFPHVWGFFLLFYMNINLSYFDCQSLHAEKGVFCEDIKAIFFMELGKNRFNNNFIHFEIQVLQILNHKFLTMQCWTFIFHQFILAKWSWADSTVLRMFQFHFPTMYPTLKSTMQSCRF